MKRNWKAEMDDLTLAFCIALLIVAIVGIIAGLRV
jgi:hypothetical protein